MGLKKEEVLDLTLDDYMIYVEGYQQRLTDAHEVAVWQGFYAGYYASPSKNRKKPVKTILKKLRKARYKTLKGKGERATTIDVDGFKEMEREFKKKMKGGQDGRREQER